MSTTNKIKLTNIKYQLEDFINSIPGSIYWKDKDGVYLGCNNTVLIKGNIKSKDDIIGKTDFDLWPEEAENFRKTDLEVMKLKKTIEAEETITLVNGTQLHFSSVKSPLKDDKGNIIGIIGNSTDITILKEAKQSAEVASLAKTQFLALVSHELRTPLSGIISSANLLLNSHMTPNEVSEFAKIIQAAGGQLLSTINGILDFAKLEADKFELVHNAVDLKSIIEDVCAILKATAKEKNINLSVSCSQSIPKYVITDARAIRHILINLIGNAIKFTEIGDVLVEVVPISFTPRSVKLKISIIDTGIGIPANKIDYIFDRFAQIETAYVHKHSRPGTGLGLSIVKKLTALIGGNISVMSKLGTGSRFDLTIDFPILN